MLTIIGGSYREICLHPRWEAAYGSGVRAAASVAAILAERGVELRTWVSSSGREQLAATAATYGFSIVAHERRDDVEFQYDHALSPPRLFPDQCDVASAPADAVSAERVLRFGLIECEPPVTAEILVYDPQAGRRARPPSASNVFGRRTAIVANATEVAAMLSTRTSPPPDDQHRASFLGKALLQQEACEVVVVKNGVEGATVVTADQACLVASLPSERVFPIGSGDVFSAVFAARWAEFGDDPVESARLASAATSYYCGHGVLPIPTDWLRQAGLPAVARDPKSPVESPRRRVYLAGPLFTLPQLWLLNETKRCLEEQGLVVFSPKDEVGFLDDSASARRIAEADLRGLEACDLVFAILDGLDPGTLFEVGYARKAGLPVVGFAERVDAGELTMMLGTDCDVLPDYATAVYRAGWKARAL